ncbi:MAG TPA: HigA family addiction module antitoxin [Bryobacteraceae bacterium]|jgi:addiction module HigA family antidote|nr:HigA family addiction module antitoxin [Bryobacteraceae bacterium]
MTSKSSIITNGKAGELLPLITPGEILLHEFLEPLDLTANALALELRVPANRIHGIAKGHRAITADTALRLSQYFGNSPEFWLNLQQNYELERAKREKFVEIQRTVPRRPPTAERQTAPRSRSKRR